MEKKLTQDGACNWGDGSASVHCKITCGKCDDEYTPAQPALPASCEDKTCVSLWMEKYGICFECENWSSYCDKPWFLQECRKTCKKCEGTDDDGYDVKYRYSTTTTTTTTSTSTTTSSTTIPPCEESECVDQWLKQYGKCYRCENYPDHCQEEYFIKSCPITCKRCSPKLEATCSDDLQEYTCQRYSTIGWCELANVSNRCKHTCGKCPVKHAAKLARQDNSEDQVLRYAPGTGKNRAQCLLSGAHIYALFAFL